MFSFRSDKTGFVVTLLLTVLAAGTVISTLVLLLVGLAQGDWSAHLLSVKWVLAGAWVACILIILVRVKIFGYQMRSRRRVEEASDDGQANSPASSEGGKVSS
jgi:hypothetical protein